MGSYLNSLIGYSTITIPFAVTGSVAGTSAVFGSVGATSINGKAAAVSGVSGSVGGAFPVAGQAPTTAAPFGSVVSSSSLYNPSDIGYATTTLSDPVTQYAVAGKAAAVSAAFGSTGTPTYNPSQIGYATTTLTDPAAPGTYGPSQIGYATTSLYSPGALPVYGPSAIGYATLSLNAPHLPVAVLTGTGLRRVAVRTWDGTRLR